MIKVEVIPNPKLQGCDLNEKDAQTWIKELTKELALLLTQIEEQCVAFTIQKQEEDEEGLGMIGGTPHLKEKISTEDCGKV